MVERDSAQAGANNGAVSATGFMQRAVVRRRLRFLRRRRELLLHDLGGFVFESHRLGEDRAELRADKLEALSTLDSELAALEHALAAREEVAVLREPGIASCPRCSTIHDSAANFCPTCGRPTAEPRAADNGAHADGDSAEAREGPDAASAGEAPMPIEAAAPETAGFASLVEVASEETVAAATEIVPSADPAQEEPAAAAPSEVPTPAEP